MKTEAILQNRLVLVRGGCAVKITMSPTKILGCILSAANHQYQSVRPTVELEHSEEPAVIEDSIITGKISVVLSGMHKISIRRCILAGEICGVKVVKSNVEFEDCVILAHKADVQGEWTLFSQSCSGHALDVEGKCTVKLANCLVLGPIGVCTDEDSQVNTVTSKIVGVTGVAVKNTSTGNVLLSEDTLLEGSYYTSQIINPLQWC